MDLELSAAGKLVAHFPKALKSRPIMCNTFIKNQVYQRVHSQLPCGGCQTGGAVCAGRQSCCSEALHQAGETG